MLTPLSILKGQSMPRTKFKQCVNVVVTIEPVWADHSKIYNTGRASGLQCAEEALCNFFDLL